MQSTFTVFTSFSQCCMMEFEGAGVTEVYPESACASLIVIFPLGRLPPITPLRLIHFQILIVYNHQTLWIDLTSGLEISCLFCMLAYAFHTHGRFDPRFFWFQHFLGASAFQEMLPFCSYPVLKFILSGNGSFAMPRAFEICFRNPSEWRKFPFLDYNMSRNHERRKFELSSIPHFHCDSGTWN